MTHNRIVLNDTQFRNAVNTRFSMVFTVFNISRNLSFAKSYKDITVNCQNCLEIIHNISSYKNRVPNDTEKQAPRGLYGYRTTAN